jgi:2-methylfumaryl-CoA hydratase
MAQKTNSGNFFEDFRLGQEIRHAIARTLTQGDVALYLGLTGSRFALTSSDGFAQSIGLARTPVDDMLVFHVVFGRSVPDISLNAIANLGYANLRFGAIVYPGDTLSARSTIIGLKETSKRDSGIVYVHTIGQNQRGEMALDFKRWVLVRKRDIAAPAPGAKVPELPDSVSPEDLIVPEPLDLTRYDAGLAGSAHLWEDYEIGERIDHVDGMTIEESDHMTATRLYQNNARVHFNQFAQSRDKSGRRLIYGGHVISIARALSFNGLANAFKLVAVNGGRHAAPCFAGNTIFAWSQVLAKHEIPGRRDIGALRLRTIAFKDRPCADYPSEGAKDLAADALILDFDYTALMPRRIGAR